MPIRDPYGYTDAKEAPPRHKWIARMIVAGKNDREIKQKMNVSQAVVDKVRNHPPIQVYMADLEAKVQEEIQKIAADLDQIAMMALESMKDDLESGDLTPHNKVEYAKIFFPLHSSQLLNPVSRKETDQTVTIVDGRELAQIQEQGRRLGLDEPTQVAVIDCTPLDDSGADQSLSGEETSQVSSPLSQDNASQSDPSSPDGPTHE